MAKRENVVRLTDSEKELIDFIRNNAERFASVETALILESENLLRQGASWEKHEKEEWANDYYEQAGFVRTFYDLLRYAKEG